MQPSTPSTPSAPATPRTPFAPTGPSRRAFWSVAIRFPNVDPYPHPYTYPTLTPTPTGPTHTAGTLQRPNAAPWHPYPGLCLPSAMPRHVLAPTLVVLGWSGEQHRWRGMPKLTAALRQAAAQYPAYLQDFQKCGHLDPATLPPPAGQPPAANMPPPAPFTLPDSLCLPPLSPQLPLAVVIEKTTLEPLLGAGIHEVARVKAEQWGGLPPLVVHNPLNENVRFDMRRAEWEVIRNTGRPPKVRTHLLAFCEQTPPCVFHVPFAAVQRVCSGKYLGGLPGDITRMADYVYNVTWELSK